jgi:hypothetical protein
MLRKRKSSGDLKRRFLMMWKAVLVVLSLAAIAVCEEPEKVTVCQLKTDPPAFNHKLVQVTSFLSHGFEDFTLQDPSCGAWPDIWLEYGGQAASGTMYCCGVTNARTRPEQIEVENISVSLVGDDNFKKLDNLLQAPRTYAMAHGVIVGRFFSGREIADGRGKHWGGYGHMGCCSLLVIQQVLAVDPHDRSDLDYESYADPPGLDKLKCGGYQYLTPIQPYQEMLESQKDAESGAAGWAFLDPRRVAVDGLAKVLKIDPRSITTMKESRKSQGKIVYRWHSKGKPAYMVVVTRPYWLSFYTQKENKVAWVLAAAIEECGQ